MDMKVNETGRAWAEGVYEKLCAKMRAECVRVGEKIPYVSENGRYGDLTTHEGIYWWTNGFWPGLLWQMYRATGEAPYRQAAVAVEKRLDEALCGFEGLHHDVGFMWLHSAVANYRLTGDGGARRKGLHAANLLAGRYNPAGRFIRAWNDDKTGWMIVDCMMNIPLLYWAYGETNDPRFLHIARGHADTCMRVTVRGDGSCNHITILDPDTGDCLENPAGQGYAPGSSWSRGNAWAVYGFALSHRHTGNAEYLDTAKRVAHYFVANMALGGWLPVVDFRAPAEPVKYDSTAAVIAACGLLEIAEHVEENERALYLDAAMNMLTTCEKAFCNWDPEFDSILDKGTAAYHSDRDAEVPIIYGDYFLVEAVLRLLGKGFHIW